MQCFRRIADLKPSYLVKDGPSSCEGGRIVGVLAANVIKQPDSTDKHLAAVKRLTFVINTKKYRASKSVLTKT